MFKRYAFLLDKSDGGASGGSGGATSEGPFTEEQQKALGAMIAGAVRSEGARVLKASLPEALKGVNWAETLKLDEVIGSKLEALLAEGDEGSGSGGAEHGGGKSAPARPSPEIAALQEKVKELTTALTTQADEAKKAKESARDEKAQAALRASLTKHVRPDALEIAASHLFVAQKRVTFDEQGNPLFLVKRSPMPGLPEEEVAMPLADGVQHWIKSEEGKFFAPAPGTGGTPVPAGGAPRRVNIGGDGLPKYDQPATTDAEKIRRAQEREHAIRAKYPNL